MRAGPPPACRCRGRPRRHGPELFAPLRRLWAASVRLCGKLLVPVLPALLKALERHHGLVLAARVRAETALRQEIIELLRRAEAADHDKDQRYGPDRRGDESPAELARR